MAAPANANGHRRRQLIARVLAESDTCGELMRAGRQGIPWCPRCDE